MRFPCIFQDHIPFLKIKSPIVSFPRSQDLASFQVSRIAKALALYSLQAEPHLIVKIQATTLYARCEQSRYNFYKFSSSHYGSKITPVEMDA